MRNAGLDNLQFEILEECEVGDLDEREIYYISLFDTYRNGYNKTSGGSGQDHEMVIKVRELWDKGDCSAEITKELNLCRETVRKYLYGYKSYSAKESHKRGYFNCDKIVTYLNTNKICQYTLDGKFLRNFNSCSEAERTLGIWAQGISNCLKNKYFSAGGFRWTREGEKLIPIDEWNNTHRKRILDSSEIQNVKELLALGLQRQDIADRTGLSLKTISRINTGESHNDGCAYPIYDYKKKKSNR